MKVHLDTDIGGDVDDICALAYLLKSADVDLVGVTTTAEDNGRRAGYTRYVLDLAGRDDVPVTAGADVADAYYRYETLGYPDDMRNWGQMISPHPGNVDKALSLLKQSIEQDALVIGIGPFTNFRLLDEKYPGILRDMRMVLMGGYVYDIPEGFPQWTNQDDWNIQVDVESAKYVFDHAEPLVIPMTVTAKTFVTRSQLPPLENAGDLGQLLARQLHYFAELEGNEARYGMTCEGLPDDFINFQHDPLACAVAIGWDDEVAFETLPLAFQIEDGYLHERITDGGKPIRIVTDVDGQTFADHWLETICAK